ncbi:hypothetical protein [Nocardia alni]|uniref:hypothetical protein n=1 Tax=Nocardia alni TaxID=2815723 RepID=UPI001C214EA2|nr:hypothetical protein [Nocardia alni]
MTARDPLLRERAALDPELMDRMDAQHAQADDAVGDWSWSATSPRKPMTRNETTAIRS